ncbi:MAG TPA: hypothetical protein VLE96_01445 [Chlamydiales bacterium]|nr:hypothetical protein [Chlamydiales bacterium]
MPLSFSSSVKSVFSAFSDILFPPLCVICKERSQTKVFCPSCWSLCSFPDPVNRCPHCFIESEGLCRQCVTKPLLPFTLGCIFEETDPAFHLSKMEGETVAAFAINAFVHLEWPIPDLVIPMPGGREVANYFAEMLQRPLGSTDPEAMNEDQVLLVLNAFHSVEELDKVVKKLALASPRRGFILSLFMPKK